MRIDPLGVESVPHAHALKIGTKVRFREAFLERHPETRKRFAGRIGEVTGYRGGAVEPIVTFPKVGRRTEQKLFEVPLARLEEVTA